MTACTLCPVCQCMSTSCGAPQGSEVVVPVPSFMKAYVASIQGHALVAGDSAIVWPSLLENSTDDESARRAAVTFDTNLKAAGRVAGRRLIDRSVASLVDANPHTHGYGGIDELIVTVVDSDFYGLIIAAEEIGALAVFLGSHGCQ